MSVAAALALACEGTADEAATPLTYHDFEDYCTFLHAGIDSDAEFCRMLGVGFRIGAPVIASGAGGGGGDLSATSANGGSSPGGTTRGPPLPSRASRSDGLRTTYSDFGSGLAFASHPYRPGEAAANRAGSPNRRQSRALAGSVDGELASAAALAHTVLLVEFENGRKALHRVPRDRFLDVSDAEGLIDRLAKVGVLGVRSARADF